MFHLVRKYGLVTVAMVLVSTVLLAAGLSRGGKAPDFSLRDTNGATFKLSAQKGKVVFVNFFATWCPPCRREFPEIVKLNNDYASKGVKVVSVAVDDSRTTARVKPFASEYKAKHPVLLGVGANEAALSYGVDGIPTNYLIGKDGKVIASWVGFGGDSDVKKWRSAIAQAMK